MQVPHDICCAALRLQPELWHAAQLAAKPSPSQRFPIATLEDLMDALLDGHGGACTVRGLQLTPEHARRFFPEVFFPVEDRHDLLRKLYAALCWGREVHKAESRVEQDLQAIAAGIT